MGRIDGRALADGIFEDLKVKADNLKARGISPSLRVLMVGDDPGSASYVRGKERDCAKVGVGFSRLSLPCGASEAEVEEAVEECNLDPSVSAFIVQLPLRGLDPLPVLSKIRAQKDADGLSPLSVARLEGGRPQIVPCTALAVWEMLKSEGIEVEGKEVCVIGRGLTSGRPISAFLTCLNATVTLAHSRTRNLEKCVRRAEIVVSCAGRPHFIKPGFISPGSVLVDVGFTVREGRLMGDFDPGCFEKAAWYTTVPGGVGPMTRAMLIYNVLELCSGLANKQNVLS
ncbi:MAG: bifunctional methylenetetrahydrofolate dehydrogenase/methenyltetrahydrofolate cyclohydrolase [Aeriscardovia sp.]|nr:bifunctional methylenetetrahydrofolate dehydrogenase/methenyltetrahydrofolate cyclohydrolase [Aeriscardovia sp.]